MPRDAASVEFSWNGQSLTGLTSDTIASALIANGIQIFGHHPKDGSPQGLFCANGQCAQCTVLVNGIPQKACMTRLLPGMEILELNQLPEINQHRSYDVISPTLPIHEKSYDVLIIGGGPAGMSAAITLGSCGIQTLLVDDKPHLGGKLVLQTHRFFGSAEDVHAGMRGIEIANLMEKEIRQYPSVNVWNAARAVGVFSDHAAGIIDQQNLYHLVKPKMLLIATGARENTLIFPGNALPGVYGAGAFQTLINRDLVKPANSVFIVGGGNVGLITGYHALQAGIRVVSLIEAAPQCGGYKVHEQKLARLGVPILTSHTIISANGSDHVESITYARCSDDFTPIVGTEQTVPCDAILVAVGLTPVNEFVKKAREFGIQCFSAGDAAEIAEASAAIISGRIEANKILQCMGRDPIDDLMRLELLAEKLKSRPGKTVNIHNIPVEYPVIQPIIHCNQEIPCNPCSISCPLHNIVIPEGNILSIPQYDPKNKVCINCERCLTICPGLAITILDPNHEKGYAIVSIPFEMNLDEINQSTIVVDECGTPLMEAEVISKKAPLRHDHTATIKVKVPPEIADKVAGIQVQQQATRKDIIPEAGALPNETIICRCERVSAGEIRSLIKRGIRDINEIKAITRAGMGACGSKTCHNLILRLFREEGIPPSSIQPNTDRPLFYEIELGILAATGKSKGSTTHE